ncbi:CHY zinc finger protein [Salisaeta longa]|uniref:CHY zinc finger protein n=1 Tax=Salisaeta longa TaxID=503170 RepID=UPI0003B4B112|nr:CHY zinc finger protein [Salisaeta longa]
MTRSIHRHTVHGVAVDAETRCAHYHAAVDRIAIRFPCCGRFYPCLACHAACADHAAERWPADARDTPAVLCGACGTVLTIAAYLHTNHRCPHCHAAFNPGCAAHYDRYFAPLPNADRRF